MYKKRPAILFMLLSVLLLSFTERETRNIDPVIGDWQVFKNSYDLSDGTSREYESGECIKKDVYSYKEDGTLHFIRYKIDRNTGECYKMPDDFWTGTWRNKNGTYFITGINKYSDTYVINRNIDSITTYTFYDNNTKMVTREDLSKLPALWGNEGLLCLRAYAYFKRMEKE